MVKCSECGILATRKMESRQFEEVEKSIRDTGKISCTIYSGNLGIGTLVTDSDRTHDSPICLLLKYNLWEEYGKNPLPPPEILCGVLHKERECKSFREWRQGFTPKEHVEMMDREWKFEQEKKSKKSDRIWHVIELVVTLAVGAIIALVAH